MRCVLLSQEEVQDIVRNHVILKYDLNPKTLCFVVCDCGEGCNKDALADVPLLWTDDAQYFAER